MDAIVNTNKSFLSELASKLHLTLNTKKIEYVAQIYGKILQHPNELKYALIISEHDCYKKIILETLTDEEKEMIEQIGSDWFPKNPL